MKQAQAHRRQLAFDLWSCVLGKPPRVPQVVQRNDKAGGGLTNLIDAHACFKGVMRPFDDDPAGAGVIAYVLKPQWFYGYREHPLCIAEKRAVADDLVFIVYARLDEPCETAGHLLKGVLTHWQFVRSHPVNRMLPIDFESRYEERLW